MNDNIKTGHYESDGGLVNLPIGFKPDYIKLVVVGQTNPDSYEWFRLQEQDEASGSQEGNITTGSTGVVTQSADAGGITAYETGVQVPTVIEYADATTPTAKTATAAGTYVRPSAGNAQDRGSLYECVTSTGAVVTEPTWPSSDGAQVTDDGSNVWEKVNVSVSRGGYEGVVVSATIQTNGVEYYYIALQAIQAIDHGDVDGWASGIDPNA